MPQPAEPCAQSALCLTALHIPESAGCERMGDNYVRDRKTGGGRPYDAVIADIGKTAAALLAENGFTMADCAGAGVGSPGTIDSQNGVVLYSNNIRWDNVPLAGELQKYLPVPVRVQNDANCAALGEVQNSVM